MIHRLPDGLEMYYEIQGKTDSETTLVFLNGLSQSTLSWMGIAPAFYADNRVILVDFIFQGQSSKAKKFRTYDEHAADIFDLLQNNANGKIILCGISYGSAIAQHLIVNYPDFFSGAILLSTFGHATPQFNAIGESWVSALNAGGYALMLDVMLPTVLGKSYFDKPLIPIATLKESRVSRDLETDSLLKLIKGTDVRGDYREKLKAVKIPVLVVQGEEDFLIPPAIAKEVADHIPDSEFLVIEKAGHTLNLEAIPQTVKLIRKFIGKF
ncbi:MAG TPA: alpha/beta hydrolase [Bacteroidia bacterium]|nr:alpha/beta hydrolase [Bacteroidia bacterium]